MPDGRVQRIDDKRQTVYIVRRGRTYAAPLAEVETRARVPSARVRFELVRRHGSESAANVRLRTGTRTNRRQRRFGDLSGARRPGAKVATTASDYFGVDVTTQPFRVVETWLAAMEDKDFDAATSLYLPEAVLHTPDGTVTGRNHVRAALERSAMVGIDAAAAEVHGIDRYVRVDCRTGPADQVADHVAYFVVERGAIVEQWLDVEPDLPEEEEAPSIVLVARGEVPAEAMSYGERKLNQIIGRLGHPVRFARIKLTKAENPANERPAMAEAMLEFDKSLVRAHSSAPTFTEAVDLATDRLADRIEHQSDRQRHKPVGQEPLPGTWRHGNLRRATAPYFDRPEEEREIVRHKSFAPEDMTVDEAAWDMALLDYDFFLFVEAMTGEDALLERTDEGMLVLYRRNGGPTPLSGLVNEVELAEGPAPRMTAAEAIERLNATDDQLIFFTNQLTGRGNVIYRRFDGHYGLVTPPSAEPD